MAGQGCNTCESGHRHVFVGLVSGKPHKKRWFHQPKRCFQCPFTPAIWDMNKSPLVEKSLTDGTGLDHYGSLITLVSAAHGAHVTYCCLVFIIPKGWTSLTELQTLAKDHRMEFQCLMYPPHAWNRLPPCCSYRIRQDSKESYRSSGFLWVPIPMGSYGFLWVPMGCWGHLHTCLQHHPLALRSGPENVARIDDQDMLQTVLQLP